jgi:diacylglycerol kinase family enzyme
MHAPAAIIVNRNAGSMRRDPGLAARLRSAAGGAAEVFVTDDLQALQELCARLASQGVPTVGVVGGDSTASLTLTALWRAYSSRELPHIALLRGGTMNTVASSLGISRQSPSALLMQLLAAMQRPQRPATCARPLMLIAERLGFLFGTGVWYGYLAETYRHGHPTLGVNVKVLTRVFASAAMNGETIRRVTRPTHVEVRFAHHTWESRPYLSIAAGTVPDVGFGFQPFHRAFDADGGFQILAIDGTARDVLRELPRLQRGLGFQSTTARQAITNWAELHAREGRIEYSVDGDIDAVQGPLRLSLGPTFEFLRL